MAEINDFEKVLVERKRLHEIEDLRKLETILEFEKIVKSEFFKTRASMITDNINMLVSKKLVGKRQKKEKLTKGEYIRVRQASKYQEKIDYLKNLLREIRIYKRNFSKI